MATFSEEMTLSRCFDGSVSGTMAQSQRSLEKLWNRSIATEKGPGTGKEFYPRYSNAEHTVPARGCAFT